MHAAFHHAVTHADIATVADLLRANPDLAHDRAEFEFTALYTAISGDDLEVAELLLSYRADPNARNDEGTRPLHLAGSAEAVFLLLVRGADINARADDGATPLFVAASSQEGIETLEALLGHGADATITDIHGTSPIEIARQREDWEIVELKRPNDQSVSRRSPMHGAIEMRMVMLLLKPRTS